MKCPVCHKEFADLPAQCPSCRADLSLSVLINVSLGKFTSEAEELLQKNPLNKNVRMMLQIWRRMIGTPDNLEERKEMQYSLSQKVSFLWPEYKRIAISVIIGIIIIGLIGFVFLQNTTYAHLDRKVKNNLILSDNILSSSQIAKTNEKPSSTYVLVRKGDSLWKLCMEIYHSESYIQKIAIENGHDPQKPIFPGQKLIVPEDVQK